MNVKNHRRQIGTSSPEDTPELTVSALMQFDENDCQLLGFIELNGSKLSDMTGSQCGKGAYLCLFGAYN
jgi:hypothetical protein